MADVKIVDIDNEQWNIKDQEARDRIAVLENNQIPEALSDVEITIKSGYSASTARLITHYKIGKIHFATVLLQNISGGNIGTTSTAELGMIPIKAVKLTSFLLFDYVNIKIARCFIGENGDFSIGESPGIVQGSNSLYGELIFVEA